MVEPRRRVRRAFVVVLALVALGVLAGLMVASGEPSSIAALGIGAVVVVLALVLVRRWSLRRRRRQRQERQQSLAEARRRGMIDVIDPMDRSQGQVQIMRRDHPRSNP